MIGAALKASGGKLDDTFGAALKRADFASVRGQFAFASNQAPVQNWYELAVVRGDDGKLTLKTDPQDPRHGRRRLRGSLPDEVANTSV